MVFARKNTILRLFLLSLIVILVFCPEASSREPLECRSFKDCEKCMRDVACFWCETSSTCLEYQDHARCTVQRWKTCSKATNDTVLLMLVVGGLFTVFCFGVSVLCIKYQLWRTEAFSKDDEDTEIEKRLARKIKHKKTLKERTDILKEKYNLRRQSP